jgi:hypothetical protein
MFDVYCPECDSRRLIFPSQVVGIHNDDAGMAVLFTCWCGATGVWRTGSRSSHDHVAWSAKGTDSPALAG